MATPAVKVQKATLYKMISYKGATSGATKYTPLTAAAEMGKFKKSFNAGMGAMTKGMNSLGATLNSISINSQNMLEGWRDSIKSQISDNAALTKKEDKYKRLKLKRETDREKAEEKRRKLLAREETEKNNEGKQPLFKKIKTMFKEGTKAGIGGLFGGLLKLIRWAIPLLLGYKILDWVSKNPDKVQKLAQGFAAIGKFVYNVLAWSAGTALDGITKFLENPISLKGIFGLAQFLIGAAPIFLGFAFLKKPLATLKALKWVIGSLGKGIMNMMKFTKAGQKMRKFSVGKYGKLLNGALVGTGAAMATLAAGGSGAEAVGAGVGAGAGQMIGAKLGAATGIPGAGAIGGALGGLAGSKIGKGIGKLLEPIMEPLKQWFGMVSKIFNDVIGQIKEPFDQFFKTLGAFMTKILDAVEPHIPLITKILGTGFKVMFFPLIMGMKALTAIMKFFMKETGPKDEVGGGGGETKDLDEYQNVSDFATITLADGTTLKKGDEGYMEEFAKSQKAMKDGMYNNSGATYEDNTKKTSENGWEMYQRDGESFAKGGWINGPQSGYPVSLDGKQTSFIGHGKEWVGRKSGGRAFVVPFDTPATRKDSSLTSRRMGEAARGGYSLPYSIGGPVYNVNVDKLAPSFEQGGTVAIVKKVSKPKGEDRPTGMKRVLAGYADMLTGNAFDFDKRGDMKDGLKRVIKQKNEDGKPGGLMRWMAGAADMMTGNLFDLDGRGNVLDGAKRLKDNVGNQINEARIKKQVEKFQKIHGAMHNPENYTINESGEPITLGGAGKQQAIVLPGKKHLDSDKFVRPKFGVIADAMTEPVELM
tara:strand:- start:13126 stop:15573 length:2448 start_codon:yes stop_codon:yes gene_type:complete